MTLFPLRNGHQIITLVCKIIYVWEGRSRVIPSKGEYITKREYFYFRVDTNVWWGIQHKQILYCDWRPGPGLWLTCDRWPGGGPQPSRCLRPVDRPRLGRWTARPVESTLYALFCNLAPGLVAASGIHKVYSRA